MLITFSFIVCAWCAFRPMPVWKEVCVYSYIAYRRLRRGSPFIMMRVPVETIDQSKAEESEDEGPPE